MAQNQKSSTAPYTKYDKQPFRYSQQYYDWRSSLNPKAADAHNRRFRLYSYAPANPEENTRIIVR